MLQAVWACRCHEHSILRNKTYARSILHSASVQMLCIGSSYRGTSKAGVWGLEATTCLVVFSPDCAHSGTCVCEEC